jgi:hypothetical protein
MNFNLAGAQFRPTEAQAAMLDLAVGQTVLLVPEPTNPFDPDAIKVVTLDDNDQPAHHIGYVPRKQTELVREFQANYPEAFCALTIPNGRFSTFTLFEDAAALDDWEASQALEDETIDDDDDAA